MRFSGDGMGTVLPFKGESRSKEAGERQRTAGSCEIVIFPGVRIERQREDIDPDAGHPATGRGKLDGTNGRRRSRKTS